MSTEYGGHPQLAPYYDAARSEAAQRERELSQESLDIGVVVQRTLGGQVWGLAEKISCNPDVSVIAEHKRCSPGEGDIRPYSDIEWTIDQYRQGGATALSILTQHKHFGGMMTDISSAYRADAGLPILRKDFIDNEYQLHEAKGFGADAVLLIVAGLPESQLRRLQREAQIIKLDTLVEVHDEAELGRALDIEPALVGINNRDLRTLAIDLQTARNLRPKIPGDVPVVVESGYDVTNADHIRELRALEVDAVLMGTSLMRQDNPAQALADWLATDQA